MTENKPSQFIIYRSEDGQTRLDVRFVDETVWLTQALMAELFQTSSDNIGQHLKNIFTESEIDETSTTDPAPSFLRKQESRSQTNHRRNHVRFMCLNSRHSHVWISACERLCKNPLLGIRYMWKTLTGLCVLLDSCFRRNDGGVQE